MTLLASADRQRCHRMTVAGVMAGGWLASLAETGLVLPAFAILGAAVGSNLVLAFIGRRVIPGRGHEAGALRSS